MCMRRTTLAFLLAFATPMIAIAQQITIIGSKTMYAMNVALARRFEQSHPGVKVHMSDEGTAKGFEAVLQNRADAAAMTRGLRPEEKKQLRAAMRTEGEFISVGLEGISIYLHPRNPVGDLRPEQVFAIFSGRITNWKEVGGANAPIHVYSFDNSTGRYWYLYDELMGRTPFVAGARYTDEHPNLAPAEGLARKEQQMLDWVAEDPDAIGFGDLKKVRIVKIAKINGFWPTPDEIRAGRYPFARRLGYVIGAKPGGALADFLHWAPKQGDIIRGAGFVPIE